MGDLWAEQRAKKLGAVKPLAARVRPRTLDEFVGQMHILGPGKLLRRMIDADRLTSVIFTGPPGTGKTTLAEVIANQTGAAFERAHAAGVGVKEVRSVIEQAIGRLEDSGYRSAPRGGDPHGVRGHRTILFLDEIHRFARNQQDVLLDAVERGHITLIGATTENPYFALNSALVSRSTIFRFDPLSEDEIERVIRSAIADERAFPEVEIAIDHDAVRLWCVKSDGDARRALTALEIAVLSELSKDDDALSPDPHLAAGEARKVHIDLDTAAASIQQKAIVYDGTGDEHYDVISAFIKSMRGSDPDAAVYWLARMLEAGEDPRFIARRIAILASEDIGLADPNAIRVASAAWEITERVGMPECQLTLSEAAIYMAVAPKSNAAARAIWAAMAAVREGRTLEVPISLRDANSTVARTESRNPFAQNAKHSDGPTRKYVYPHDYADGFVEQDYLGVSHIFYEPTDRGMEARIADRLKEFRQRRIQANSPPTAPPSDSSHSSVP